jgi:hypothetical protein
MGLHLACHAAVAGLKYSLILYRTCVLRPTSSIMFSIGLRGLFAVVAQEESLVGRMYLDAKRCDFVPASILTE